MTSCQTVAGATFARFIVVIDTTDCDRSLRDISDYADRANKTFLQVGRVFVTMYQRYDIYPSRQSRPELLPA